MNDNDTVKLLRECDAGIKMGVASIDDVLPYVTSEQLRDTLTENKKRHEHLGEEVERMLTLHHEGGKEPGLMAKSMSHMKTGIKLSMDKSDATVADLMSDGCHMGVKSLGRYLNQYAAADEASRDLAKKLIHLEDSLAVDVRPFL